MHHTTDIAPPGQHYQKRPWERPHLPNKTGTPQAYRPKGSALNAAEPAAASGDYTPWTPKN